MISKEKLIFDNKDLDVWLNDIQKIVNEAIKDSKNVSEFYMKCNARLNISNKESFIKRYWREKK